MRRACRPSLRAGRLPAFVPAKSPVLLPVPNETLVPHILPQLLLGPTGCGKSSLLSTLARQAVTARVPTPTVFLRLRAHGSKSSGSSSEAKVNMDAAASQLYAQIGFPRRRAHVSSMLARGLTFQGNFNQVAIADSSVRLVSALETLFSVCEELRNERVASGIAELDAAPLLLFDEMQDLLKDVRLKAAGGELVFNTLARLIVFYSVDLKAVRVIAAGSSAELMFAFENTVAKGSRWRPFLLADPFPDAVTRALEQRSYSSNDARDILALCGTRLRLLSPVLEGAQTVSAKAFLSSTLAVSRASISHIFSLWAMQHAEHSSCVSLMTLQLQMFAPQATSLCGCNQRISTPCGPAQRGRVDDVLCGHGAQALFPVT